MSWLDNIPDRQIDPDEHDHPKCPLCDADIPVTSRSPYYCDDCFDERVKDHFRRDLNKELIKIGSTRLDESFERLEKHVKDQA